MNPLPASQHLVKMWHYNSLETPLMQLSACLCYSQCTLHYFSVPSLAKKNDQPVMQDGNACTTFLTELFWSSIQQVLGRAVKNRSEQDAGSTFLCFQTDRAKTDNVVFVF